MDARRYVVAGVIVTVYLAIVLAAAFINQALIPLASVFTPVALIPVGWIFGKGIRDQLTKGGDPSDRQPE